MKRGREGEEGARGISVGRGRGREGVLSSRVARAPSNPRAKPTNTRPPEAPLPRIIGHLSSKHLPARPPTHLATRTPVSDAWRGEWEWEGNTVRWCWFRKSQQGQPCPPPPCWHSECLDLPRGSLRGSHSPFRWGRGQ